MLVARFWLRPSHIVGGIGNVVRERIERIRAGARRASGTVVFRRRVVTGHARKQFVHRKAALSVVGSC